MTDQPTVAVLGTGIMGAPMARHLAEAGHRVSAWNRSPDKLEPLGERGVHTAASAAEAADGADVVITMLAHGEAVDAVVDDEVLSAIGDGVWAQSSTVGLDWTSRLAGRAAEAGVAYADTPVLGTKAPAEKGELIVLAAAPSDRRPELDTVFDAYAATVRWLDEVGQPSKLKLVLNLWIVNLVEALGEAVALAEGLELDPATFLETIEGGPLDLDYAQLKGSMMTERRFDTSFPLSLAAKDARLAVEAARAAGLRLPATDAVAQALTTAAEDERLAGLDMAAAVEPRRPPRGS